MSTYRVGAMLMKTGAIWANRTNRPSRLGRSRPTGLWLARASFWLPSTRSGRSLSDCPYVDMHMVKFMAVRLIFIFFVLLSLLFIYAGKG